MRMDLPPANSLLFVYGTLQRGGQYHYLMENAGAEWMTEARLASRYPLLIAAYPCLLDQPGSGFHVHGELYRLPNPEAWIAIDQLENHPHEYRRRVEPVSTQSGLARAWTYFYIRDDLDPADLTPVERFHP